MKFEKIALKTGASVNKIFADYVYQALRGIYPGDPEFSSKYNKNELDVHAYNRDKEILTDLLANCKNFKKYENEEQHSHHFFGKDFHITQEEFELFQDLFFISSDYNRDNTKFSGSKGFVITNPYVIDSSLKFDDQNTIVGKVNKDVCEIVLSSVRHDLLHCNVYNGHTVRDQSCYDLRVEDPESINGTVEPLTFSTYFL